MRRHYFKAESGKRKAEQPPAARLPVSRAHSAFRFPLSAFTSTSPPSRRGLSLVELVISCVLLSTVMLITVPTLSWIATERRAAAQRQEAIEEMSNLMERITAEPWGNLTQESIGEFTLHKDIEDQLPNAVLTWKITQRPDDPAAKKISGELVWNSRAGQPVAPVRLTAWVHQQGAAK